MTNNDIFNIIIYNVMVQISKKFPDNVSFNIDDISPSDYCHDDKNNVPPAIIRCFGSK